jgi:uncharacterized membrane protein YhaH (DUF805 family)
MGAWLSNNFSWSGFTSRQEYRRWLPLIIVFEVAQILALWVWGVRGAIRLSATPTAIIASLVFLALSIGFVLLTARRFQSAGITRKWMLPMFLIVNIPFGGYYLNCAMLWVFGLIAVAALQPDIPGEARVY